MNNKTLYITIAALVVALFFSVGRCSHEQRTGNDNAAALTDSVHYYKNRLGTTTASIATLQLDKKQAKDLLLKKDAELAALAKAFARVHAITKYEAVTRIDTVAVAYHDTVPCVFERSGEVKDKWYSFTYHSNQNGFTAANFEAPNTATVITGTKRKWFLGKETVTTDITNTNPYIKVTQIKAAEITIPAPVYKKWYVWLGVGLAGGYLLGR